jgi:voltage-gated potassium channel Kch
VIITSPDSSVTVKLVASLNPRRYRIEHIHDLSEALLRAEFVLAHAIVVHLEELGDGLARRLTSAQEHGVSVVLVSSSEDVVTRASELGVYVLRSPFGVTDVKRKVLEAVSDAHLGRSGDAPVSSRRPSRPELHRVVLLVGERDAAEIMAALMRSQLGVACDTAATADDATRLLARGFDCLVARSGLLLGSEAGAALARKLARRGVPVVPLAATEDLDAGNAGAVAWALIPLVRRSLAARSRLTRTRQG